VLLLWSAVSAAQPKPEPTLPLRSVRLYEAGVGYFERSGRLGKASELTLPVPPAHLDDALKTLVVLAKDGKAAVTGIEFGSSVSAEMGRALAGLPDGQAGVTYQELLRSLKGAGVEVRTGREALRGRLVDVLEPGQSDITECAAEPTAAARKVATGEAGAVPCTLEKQATLLLLTDRAEVRRLKSSDVVSVRPTDPALVARLASSLDAMSQTAQAQKQLKLVGSSTSEVTLGYVAEAPVWRPTYRMVFDAAADRAVLQGWVLVHNDTDEPWQKVKVELVNGRPDSFLFPLAAPRYGRRELVTPREQLSTVPQLLGKTVDGMWGDEIGDSFGASGLGLTGTGEGGGGTGEGIGLGQIGTGQGGGADAPSTLLSVGNLAATTAAQGVEAGALFRYTLPTAVDLRAHGSALLPFVQMPVAARRIAWFPTADAPARSGARVSNDTKQTLPAGTIAFFADGGFAGESQLGRMKPGEAALVAFGADLDVELSTKNKQHRDETRLVTFSDDKLHDHFVRHHSLTYGIENRSGSGRTVVLSLPYVRNASVKGADEVDFDVPTGKGLALFRIDAKKQADRKLDVDEGLTRATPFAALDWRALRTMADSAKLPAAQRTILREAAKHIMDAQTHRGLVPKREADLQEVVADLARLRAHVAVIRDSDDAEDLIERILHKEDRIKSLRTRIRELHAESAAFTARARATLSRLGRSKT
jgi:hypothetical protein